MTELFTAGRTAGRPAAGAVAGTAGGSAGADTAGPLLFCFPPAGAGPSIFSPWRRRRGSLDLRILALPGRDGRIGETPSIDVPGIADAVQQAVSGSSADRPYAFYGHSLGGLVSYETAAELGRRGVRLPARMFLGASRPPVLVDPLRTRALLPDDEFLEAIRELGGLPDGVIEVPELRELVLPALRHDFRWLHDYTYVPDAALPIPMVVISGLQDPVTSSEVMQRWGELSTAPVATHRIDGGHLFLQSNADDVLDLIESELTPSTVGLVPLPGTDWQVWGSALLRTAGFPADGLRLLSAPDCARVADEYLAGRRDRTQFTAAFDGAATAVGDRLRTLASEPALREAVAWQNPGALTAFDKLAEYPPGAPSTNKRRKREKAVAQYWARYCGKNDTIGFFGPVCWAEITDSAGVRLAAGPGLTRRRVVHLEWWVLQALVDSWTVRLRRWLPVRRQPHHSLLDGYLHRPGHRRLELSAAESAVLSRCDGRTAGHLASAVIDDDAAGFRKEADVLLLLDRLAERELLRWQLDLPLDLTAQRFLDDWLTELADSAGPDVAAGPRVALDRLLAAKDEVAAAAGDADAVTAAMTRLGAVFTELTGREPRQRAGQTYAGRGLCFEDTERDLSVTIGSDILQHIAAPLEPLLQAARWLTAAIGDTYSDALRVLHQDTAEMCGSAAVPLEDMWLQVWSLIFGLADRPIDQVLADFAERWEQVLQLARLPRGTRRLDIDPADLSDRVHKAFPARTPGWSGARVHSPDLVLCASGPEALQRGEFTAVLGEMHAAWLTCSAGAVTQFHPDPAALRATVHRDLGARTVPLYPTDYYTLTARLADAFVGSGDLQVGYTAAPVSGDVVPVAGATAIDVAGEILVRFPDGRHRTMLEVIAEFLATYAADAFKLLATGEYTPRVTAGSLVLARESWRTTIADCGLATAESVAERYLAARRLAGRLGLPDQVFVKIASEIKPFHVDLTSPVSISALCTMMRSASSADGDQVAVGISEMLPTPEQAWVPDTQGRHYFSELRLHVLDPQHPAGWTG